MANVYDRVQETSTTTGTGTLTLAGAVAGYQSFATAVGSGTSLVYYTITDASNSWEVGVGTYTVTGTTLSRTTVLASSNAGALVSFGAGTKTVWCDAPAQRIGGTFDSIIFGSSAGRILGDMSNATTANQVAFQSSTTNGYTQVNAIPNGTATSGWFSAYNAADPNNAGYISIGANGATDCRVVAGKNGTGVFLPLAFLTNGAVGMTLSTSQSLGIGGASVNDGRLELYPASLNAAISVFPATSGASSGSSVVRLYATSSTGGAYGSLQVDSSGNALVFSSSGTVTLNSATGVLFSNANAVGTNALLYASSGVANPAFQVANSGALRVYDNSGMAPSGTGVVVNSNVVLTLTGAAGSNSVLKLTGGDSTTANNTLFCVNSGGSVTLQVNNLGELMGITNGTHQHVYMAYLYVRLNTAVTLANATGNQSIYGVSFNVLSGYTYEFEGEFKFTSTGTTSHTESIGFGGTATVSTIGFLWQRYGTLSTTATGPASLYQSAVTMTAITAAITTAQTAAYRVKGTVYFTSAGTFIPQIAFSAAMGATSTVGIGAYFKMKVVDPDGAGAVNYS